MAEKLYLCSNKYAYKHILNSGVIEWLMEQGVFTGKESDMYRLMDLNDSDLRAEIKFVQSTLQGNNKM